ncbi:hypothetical protein GCM10010399_21730 [Dactylosporangium fulvum]|uniref:GNAT family N-acetyltransferase n=1 Tax=Dactylosporangium fulvum TaxID=53359 RepID=A0ABY5W7W5_9ACTN|nr:GNAT family N-acetyltransferase [Dactylosporangium fulvum]UWP85569.1 GNAT family N-acetyltransferase [Dactylosporangium fulvum]
MSGPERSGGAAHHQHNVGLRRPERSGGRLSGNDVRTASQHHSDPERQEAEDVTAAAFELAEQTARACGVELRTLAELADLERVCELYQRVWGAIPQEPPMTRDLLRAMVKSGSYVAGAYAAGELVGACVGFFSPPVNATLHSHIMGVSNVMRGRNVGFALKVHQRAWCLERGVSSINWTFDPLVRRNAHFNLTKLNADAVEYLENYYGGGHDDLNGDDETDRLLVNWNLPSAAVAAACRGEHSSLDAAALLADGAAVGLASVNNQPRRGPTDARTVLVAVPEDIEYLRAAEPGLAAEWRYALRETLAPLIAARAQIVGFARTGWFVVVQGNKL